MIPKVSILIGLYCIVLLLRYWNFSPSMFRHTKGFWKQLEPVLGQLRSNLLFFSTEPKKRPRCARPPPQSRWAAIPFCVVPVLNSLENFSTANWRVSNCIFKKVNISTNFSLDEKSKQIHTRYMIWILFLCNKW